MVAQIAKHLGLSKVPDDLLLWNLNDVPENWGSNGCGLEEAISEAMPDLVVLDPLNATFKQLEQDNTAAGGVLQELRRLMRGYDSSFLGVHHRRKFDPRLVTKEASLEYSADLRRWFDNARGPGIIINGSDLRLGIEPSMTDLTGNQLIVRGFRRVHGEVPGIRVRRVLDEDGEPVGYSLMSDADLLPAEQREAFARLPGEFAFKDAMLAYARKNEATDAFLKRFIGAGLLTKPRRGWYVKTEAHTATPAPPGEVQPEAA
jgi:hypothetical protein